MRYIEPESEKEPSRPVIRLVIEPIILLLLLILAALWAGPYILN